MTNSSCNTASFRLARRQFRHQMSRVGRSIEEIILLRKLQDVTEISTPTRLSHTLGSTSLPQLHLRQKGRPTPRTLGAAKDQTESNTVQSLMEHSRKLQERVKVKISSIIRSSMRYPGS
jgi:hypothetical protein